MAGSERFAVLDAGRALAIVGVIAIHLALFLPNLPEWLQQAAPYGQYGVQLFFVISAITICKTLDDARQRTVSTAQVIRGFYVKRFFRIAPLYYVGIVAYGLVDLLGTRFAHAQMLTPHHAVDVVANLLFVHAWSPTGTNSVVPGGWSIGVEMFFYAIAPLLFFISESRRGLWAVTIATALFSAVFIYAVACHGHASCAIPNNSYLYYWPPTQLPCFIVGFWLWHLGRPWLSGARRPSPRATTVATAAFAGFALLLVTSIGLGAFAAVPLIAALASAMLLILMCRAPARALLAPPVLHIGQNSYGIYIWHFLGICGVRVLLKTPFAQIAADHPLTAFVLCGAGVLLFAHVAALFTARHLEQPMSRWARHRLIDGAPRRARQPSSAVPSSAPPAPLDTVGPVHE